MGSCRVVSREFSVAGSELTAVRHGRALGRYWTRSLLERAGVELNTRQRPAKFGGWCAGESDSAAGDIEATWRGPGALGLPPLSEPAHGA